MAHRCSQVLEDRFMRESFIDAFVQGGLYSMVASVPQGSQRVIASLHDSVSSGMFDVNAQLASYVESAREMKRLFIANGFNILYKEDAAGPVSDGFYFTAHHPNYSTGNALLSVMLKCGLTAVPLGIFGGNHKEGLRICTSLVPMDKMDILEERLVEFKGLQ